MLVRLETFKTDVKLAFSQLGKAVEYFESGHNLTSTLIETSTIYSSKVSKVRAGHGHSP